MYKIFRLAKVNDFCVFGWEHASNKLVTQMKKRKGFAYKLLYIHIAQPGGQFDVLRMCILNVPH